MPSLLIPESGLSLGSVPLTGPKSRPVIPDVFGLTLSDGVIEDMIKCVQVGKPIQLSLGDHQSISYGNKIQQLSTTHDSCPKELFQSTQPSDSKSSTTSDMAYYNKSKQPEPNERKGVVKVQPKFHSGFHALFSSRSLKASQKPTLSSSKPTIISTTSATAGTDAALATLQSQLASHKSDKEAKVTRLVDRMPGQRRGGQTKPTKNKLLANKLSNDVRRSTPSSPYASGFDSPSLGPTSVPLSQQQSENAKSERKPVIHLLAINPMTDSSLLDRIDDLSQDDINRVLKRVADYNEATKKWELRRNYFKELDVYAFEYENDQDRDTAISNTIKVYDKMRLSSSEPEWERLNAKSKRGQGICLSKVQAQIVKGPVQKPPKVSVNGTESGRDTPMGGTGDEDEVRAKKVLKAKKGDSRSLTQPPKTKKIVEKETTMKKTASGQTKKSAPKAIAKATPKEKPSTKVLSAQFVTDSDDEEVASTKPAPSPLAKDISVKRRRDEESSTGSDSSIPLSKKVRKDISTTQRVSEASQTSHLTGASTSGANKSISPRKSSPLASSPPTNASDFENSSSASSTPAHSSKSSSSPQRSRHQKSSSVSSTSSSIQSFIKKRPDIVDLARKYRSFYSPYKKLHKELRAETSHRDKEKERRLLSMHDRLVDLKRQISEATEEAARELDCS